MLAIVAVLIGVSCRNSETAFVKADSDLEAGRNFIEGVLKGDFKKAAFFMLDDEQNQSYLNKLKRRYRERSEHERKQYAEASIVMMDVDVVSDTVTIISYHNSFDNIARKVKVVNKNKEWLVDLKYTVNGNL